MESRRNLNQSGFTLIELLVVVAVLGIMSGVAVLGVGSLGERAQQSACTTDDRILRTALEAHFALTGNYTDEDGLVAAELLDEPSTRHDVSLTGLDYEIAAVGDCIGVAGDEELAEGEPADRDEATKGEVDKSDDDKVAQEEAEQEKIEVEKAGDGTSDEDKVAEDEVAQEKAEQEKIEQEKIAEEQRSKEQGQTTPRVVPAGCAKDQVDINSADKKELTQIMHVGGDEAVRITKQRPFSSLKELQSVKGLDENEVAEIMKQGLACIAG